LSKHDSQHGSEVGPILLHGQIKAVIQKPPKPIATESIGMRNLFTDLKFLKVRRLTFLRNEKRLILVMHTINPLKPLRGISLILMSQQSVQLKVSADTEPVLVVSSIVEAEGSL
jgi:hypothetical protein